MTPAQLDTFATSQGGYLAAAALYADIADQFEGLGDPYFDTLAQSFRRTSLAFLARATTLTGA